MLHLTISTQSDLEETYLLQLRHLQRGEEKGMNSPRPMEQKEKKEKELRNNEAHVRQPGISPGG